MDVACASTDSERPFALPSRVRAWVRKLLNMHLCHQNASDSCPPFFMQTCGRSTCWSRLFLGLAHGRMVGADPVLSSTCSFEGEGTADL